MDEADFHAVQRLLSRNGFVLLAAQYHPDAFGSWYVEVAATAPLRVVWDGRDGWMIVQVKTGETFNGFDVWHDLSVQREASEQTPERALATVLAQAGAA